MATVSETIEAGRTQVESLQLSAFAHSQLLGVLSSIERAVSAAREKASEALTLLRAPELATRPALANIAAGDLLDEALALLDGTQEPES